MQETFEEEMKKRGYGIAIRRGKTYISANLFVKGKRWTFFCKNKFLYREVEVEINKEKDLKNEDFLYVIKYLKNEKNLEPLVISIKGTLKKEKKAYLQENGYTECFFLNKLVQCELKNQKQIEEKTELFTHYRKTIENYRKKELLFEYIQTEIDYNQFYINGFWGYLKIKFSQKKMEISVLDKEGKSIFQRLVNTKNEIEHVVEEIIETFRMKNRIKNTLEFPTFFRNQLMRTLFRQPRNDTFDKQLAAHFAPLEVEDFCAYCYKCYDYKYDPKIKYHILPYKNKIILVLVKSSQVFMWENNDQTKTKIQHIIKDL